MTQIAIFEQFNGLTVDRQIKAVIGMGRDKFDQLVPVFSASYATIQQERLQNKEIKNLPWGGPRSGTGYAGETALVHALLPQNRSDF